MRGQWYYSNTWNMILPLHEWSYWLQRTCFAASPVTLLCSNCIYAAVCQGHMWLPESRIALCCGNLISNLVLLICIMNKVIQHKSESEKSGSFSSPRVFYVEATLCIMFLLISALVTFITIVVGVKQAICRSGSMETELGECTCSLVSLYY